MPDSESSTRTVRTFCRICEALCGLEVDVDPASDRVLAIRPDPEHVATDGFACVKGLRQHEIYDSGDRLTTPMRRGPKGLEPATWKEALADIGQRVADLRRDHGPDSIAMYVGTAAGFSVLHPIFAQGFMTGVGSKSMYASATQDCANKFAVARHVYGFPFTQPSPDVDHTQCLIIVGANPAVSKWSFGQVPNPIRRLKGIVARGGQVFVVDPRKTETAKAAGEHVFIRPRTDVFFYLSFLHEVVRRDGAVDEERVRRFMRGLPYVRELAEPWTPQRTEKVTGIPAQTLRRMVDAYLQADGAALYCSTGVNMGSRGSLAFWLQEVINAITGNLDRVGGTLVGRGILDFPRFAKDRGILMRDDRSRVGGYPAVNDAFPGGVLADEILTDGPGQVRALFCTGGNPLLTMANSGRLRHAFEKLDLVVALDILPTETASMADWVLPCTSPLQRWDLPFLFPLLLGLQSKPYLQATRPVVRPVGEQRDEATIYLDLCRASGVNIFGSAVAQRSLEAARTAYSLGRKRRELPQSWLLSALLRTTGQGGLSELLAHEHGRLREPHASDDFLGKRVVTDDGKVDLAPAALLEAAGDLERWFTQERGRVGGLRLITRRAVTTHNSWTHNHPKFVGREGTNYLYIHPEDARRIGLDDGALADVATDVATVRVPVSLCRDLMPGTVALPHGWGHQAAQGLSVASRTRGVNVNLLAADGPGQLEPVSGMAHLTGLDVRVTKAAGPQSTGDWSGVD